MMYLNKPVAYFEEQDFDAQGNLINPEVPKNLPVVIMLQAGWCPHCTNAKPVFQEFANMMKGKVFCGTIQADGDKESEKVLGKRISTVIKPGSRGFPDYVLYKNGKRISKEIAGRDMNSLKAFAGV